MPSTIDVARSGTQSDQIRPLVIIRGAGSDGAALLGPLASKAALDAATSRGVAGHVEGVLSAGGRVLLAGGAAAAGALADGIELAGKNLEASSIAAVLGAGAPRPAQGLAWVPDAAAAVALALRLDLAGSAMRGIRVALAETVEEARLALPGVGAAAGSRGTAAGSVLFVRDGAGSVVLPREGAGEPDAEGVAGGGAVEYSGHNLPGVVVVVPAVGTLALAGAADALAASRGLRVGVLRLRAVHPFPAEEVAAALRGLGTKPELLVSLQDWTSAVPTGLGVDGAGLVLGAQGGDGAGAAAEGDEDNEDEDGQGSSSGGIEDESKAEGKTDGGDEEEQHHGAAGGVTSASAVSLAKDEDAAGRVEAASALAWLRGAVQAAAGSAHAVSAVALPAREWGRARGLRRLLGVASSKITDGTGAAADVQAVASEVVASRGIEVVRLLAAPGSAVRGAEVAVGLATSGSALAFEAGLAPWASNAGVHLQWRALATRTVGAKTRPLSASAAAFLLLLAAPTEVVLVDDLEVAGSADLGAALGSAEGAARLRIVDERAAKRVAEARRSVALANGGTGEDEGGEEGGPDGGAAGSALESLLSREDAACLAVAEGVGQKALALYAATTPRMSVEFLGGSTAASGAVLSLGGPQDLLAGAGRARTLVLDAEEAAEEVARARKEAEEAGPEALDGSVLAQRALQKGGLGASPARMSSGLSVASGGTSSVPPLADFAPKIAVSAHAVLGLKAAGLAAVVDPEAKALHDGALGVLGSSSGIERDAGSRVWAEGELEEMLAEGGPGEGKSSAGGSSGSSTGSPAAGAAAAGRSVAGSVASTARLSRSLRLVPLSHGIILHPAAAADALEGLIPTSAVAAAWAAAAAASASSGPAPAPASGAGTDAAGDAAKPATAASVLAAWPAPRSALPAATLALEEQAAKEAAEAAAEDAEGEGAPLGTKPPAPPSVESSLKAAGEAPRHPAMPLLFPESFGSTVRARPAEEEEVFVVKVQAKKRLTPAEYHRNIFHIEFDTRGTGLKYEIGAALGVFGHNDPKEVDTFLRWYGVDGSKAVTLPPPELMAEGGAARELPPGCAETTTVRRAFTQVLDLFGKPGKAFYEKLGAYATDVEERVRLFYYATQEGKEGFRRRAEDENVTYADVLQEFPSAKPPLLDLLTLIPAIKPRHYSIASSQRVHPGSVHLLVVLVDWKDSRGRPRTGQCTRYLEGLGVGEQVAVSIKPSVMLLPPDHRSPVVMAGLGTGMAPFRAFIEERAWFK